MKVITSISDMRELVDAKRSKNYRIGFVPTMGYLHEGHLSLIYQAKKENDVVVMSLFVNPLQFGPNEDYDQYPRNFDQDKKVAEEAGVDVLFYPQTGEMYPRTPVVSVSVDQRADVLCGQTRPGHFNGVATVVTKLFHIVNPTRVYFGRKDAQQAAIIEGLVEDLNFPLTVVTCPTIREDDGLALSSRNVHLSPTEREEAPSLYQSLQYGENLYHSGERNVEKLRSKVSTFLHNNVHKGNIDYVDVLAYPSLTKEQYCTGKMMIAIAVQYEKARLIDNILLSEK